MAPQLRLSKGDNRRFTLLHSQNHFFSLPCYAIHGHTGKEKSAAVKNFVFFIFSFQDNQVCDLWRNSQTICKAERKAQFWFKLHD